MADVENALPITSRRTLRTSLPTLPNVPFLHSLPKVDLHLHIEGILNAELKWKFSQRNNLPIINPRTGLPFPSLAALQASHDTMKPPDEGRMDNTEETMSFFEAYYGGFEALKTEEDYFDLGMFYFEKAARMNVRYCELFFDPQGHTRTGMAWEVMMGGFRRAQRKAEKELNIKSAWIMCFLRDSSPESAMEHYLAALDYRDMIVGIGLDSNEDQRPPVLFEEVFARARADGFRLTAHCDVGKTYPLEHIRQVVSVVGKTGADRIDHGLNVVDSPELMALIRSKGIGMTICPWSYIRHQPFDQVFERIRALFDAGIKIAIASDDPAFMEDTWIMENLQVVQQFCKLTDSDMLTLARDAVDMCWAPEQVKKAILDELKGITVQ